MGCLWAVLGSLHVGMKNIDGRFHQEFCQVDWCDEAWCLEASALGVKITAWNSISVLLADWRTELLWVLVGCLILSSVSDLLRELLQSYPLWQSHHVWNITFGDFFKINIIRGRVQEKDGERQRHLCERNVGWFCMCSDQGLSPQSSYVPWLGIKLAGFLCMGQHSNQLNQWPGLNFNFEYCIIQKTSMVRIW